MLRRILRGRLFDSAGRLFGGPFEEVRCDDDNDDDDDDAEVENEDERDRAAEGRKAYVA